MDTKRSFERLLSDGLIWQGSPNSPIPASLLAAPTSPLLQKTTTKMPIPFGVDEIDRVLPFGGLPQGTIHEFGSTSKGEIQITYPPCSILALLAGKALSKNLYEEKALQKYEPKSFILWIGKSIWPTPYLLQSRISLEHPPSLSILSHSIFIDPPDEKLRLWSLEAALRSPAVSAVIVECKNLKPTLSRRFSLAAEKSGALGLFIRPASSLKNPSSSYSRWSIAPARSPTTHPRFELSLLRCKGGPSETVRWIFELDYGVDHEKISLHIPSDVALQPHREKEEGELHYYRRAAR